MFLQWAVRYRGFAAERFDKFSRGGGDWRPLKPKTIARRRKGKGVGGASILRDTNTLFSALAPSFVGSPGAIEEDIADGIRVGYGGPGRHPSGGATVSDIAIFHNEGTKHVPARPIIVDPPASVVEAMAGDVARWWKTFPGIR